MAYLLKIVYYLPLLLGSGIVFLTFFGPLSDPDFWWHLHLGKDMVAGSGIPRQELYSWTMAGRPFVDFYWLYDFMLAKLFLLLQPALVSALFALVGLAILFIRLGDTPKNSWRAMALLSLMAFAFLPVFGIRPVVFSWLFFVLLLWLINKTATFSLWLCALLSLLLFILWVNIHDGFVFPLAYLSALLALHLLFQVFALLQQDWAPKPFLSTSQFTKIASILGTAIIALCITPYGIQYITTIIYEAGSAANKMHIDEWQPLGFRHPLGFIYYVTSLLTFSYLAYKNIPKPHEWLLLLIFFIIGASGVVHAPFFLLLLLPYAAKMINGFAIPSQLKTYAKWYIALPLLAGTLLLATSRWHDATNSTYAEASWFPVKALTAVKQLRPQGRMYNEYSWGGYIAYHLPEYKIFSDGRMAAWQKNGKYLIEEQIWLDSLAPNYKTVLLDYNPDWFFIKTGSSLTQWLETNTDYQTVYKDTIATIIVRK